MATIGENERNSNTILIKNKNPIFITLTKQQNVDDVQKQHTPLFYFLISADAMQVLQQKKLHSF